MTSKVGFDDPGTELAARRTGMAFQRTRLAADRTLMAVIRTSLSLISFGFTIHKVFQSLKEQALIAHEGSARNFGLALVAMGVLMLIIGIAYHGRFMLGLRHQRTALVEQGLVHGESGFPPSMTLITAILLLLLGLLVVGSMYFRTGPFE